MTRPIKLEEAVAAAREELGTPRQLAQLRAAIESQLADAAAPTQPTLELSPLAAAGTVHTKLVVTALFVFAATGGAMHLSRQDADPERPRPVVAAPRALPAEARLQPEPARSVPAPAPATAPSLTAAPAPIVPRRVQPRPVKPMQPKAAPTPALSEVELITRAQAALDRDPLAARGLLERHHTDYPNGMLSEERDVLAVDAELALGQSERARELARTFVAHYPRSSQVRRFEKLLADHKPGGVQKPTE